ncbi:hypothetical protein N481_01695 [Pseudoalteromonas luteoviolacea S4047-1]|uniref:Salt-induced outer membrane protein n=2 Tax=Pseudoalteromonas luteoviolacea TaxID=43657 RepID=A0A0F6AG06_9GAMM|nr:hypothetical protein N479_06585 [Pseudoalteromonas luteoviolacea S4054]KZN70216.1 hypothetical protein N481_01695 [Pseudoalteromonas luteoviolacea S4047-1]
MKKVKLLLLMSAFCSLQAFAVDPFEDFHKYGELSEEEIHELHQGEFLYGDMEFGFIASSGNTKNSSFKIKGNVYQDFKYWRNQFKIDGHYADETDTETGIEDETASRYFVSAKTSYKFGADNESFFVYGDYEADQFNGREYTTTFVVGYGNRLFEGRKNTVDFHLGPGVLVYRVDDETELLPHEERVERGHLLRASLQWERNISKRTRFNQDFSYEESLSGLGSRGISETALISQVIEGLSLKVSYTYRYNSAPEEDKRKVDTELGVTFVYSFD